MNWYRLAIPKISIHSVGYRDWAFGLGLVTVNRTVAIVADQIIELRFPSIYPPLKTKRTTRYVDYVIIWCLCCIRLATRMVDFDSHCLSRVTVWPVVSVQCF